MGEITRRRLIGTTLAATASSAVVRAGSGPSRRFPGKPIGILVSFAAGGGNDVIARILAQQMSEGPLGTVW